MLSRDDLKRGYPAQKEETALFQLALVIVFLLILAFFAGQVFEQFGGESILKKI